MNIIIVLKARNQTLRLANALKASGYNARIIDTPLSLYGSCTLSVLTDKAGLDYFYKISYSYPTFVGVYNETNGKYVRIF